MSSIPVLQQLFAEDIRRLPDLMEKQSTGCIRFSRTADNAFSILEQVTNRDIPERFYFRNKAGDFELGGLGTAWLIEGSRPREIDKQLDQVWSCDERIRLFGGMHFDPAARKSSEWSAFGTFRFMVPFLEYCRFGNQTVITLTCRLAEGDTPASVREQISRFLDKLDTPADERPPLTAVDLQAEQQIPDRRSWVDNVRKALDMIHSGQISKVVLARKKILVANRPWPVDWIFRHLADTRENAFLFFIQPEAGSTFLGRTPERLFRLSKDSLTVDAIAGTEPRGKNGTEDRRFEKALTESPKEREEQQIVASYVTEKLSGLCTATRIDVERSILKLDKVQHLVSRYFGVPRAGLTALETLTTLHPTPAVGTHPCDAGGVIRELESFERGWYAGPIGWMDHSSAEFAVAIRSALIRGDELHVFAGAGIVAQSDPEREWQEINDKMANFSFITGARE